MYKHKLVLKIFLSITFLLIFPALAISGQGSDFPSTGRASVLLADGLVGWPYQFDQNQISRLNSAGCMFNDEDLAVANRMMNRQFSAEDFVAAYEQAAKMNLRGDAIEKIATFKFLFLPMEEYETMKSNRMNVTEYYNSRIGGEGTKTAGILISIPSLIFLSLGIAALVDAAGRDSDCDNLDNNDDMGSIGCMDYGLGYLFGYTLTVSGFLGLVTGGSLIAIGSANTSRWAKGLDSTPKDEMNKYRLSPQNNDDTIERQNNNDPEYTKLIYGFSPLIAGGSNKPNGLALKIIF